MLALSMAFAEFMFRQAHRCLGSRDGAVVRALAFHQCGPGSIPCPGVIRGLSLLLVLLLAPRVFLRVLRFSSLHKNQHLQIPVRSGRHVFTHEPLAWEIRRLSPHYDVKLDLIYFSNLLCRRF